MFKQPIITNSSPSAFKSNPKGTSKIPLMVDGQVTGIPIELSQGSVSTVHEAPAGVLDEIYLWASNYSASSANILISVGDSSFPSGKVIEAQLAGKNGLVLVYPGIPHTDAVIYAKASADNAINLIGFVVRNYSINNTDVDYGYHNSGD